VFTLGCVAASHADQTKKKTALQITSTAENSTKDWTAAYAYIEDIHDGRGYTGGLVGFTTATSNHRRAPDRPRCERRRGER
jgi:chitosanase